MTIAKEYFLRRNSDQFTSLKGDWQSEPTRFIYPGEPGFLSYIHTINLYLAADTFLSEGFGVDNALINGLQFALEAFGLDSPSPSPPGDPFVPDNILFDGGADFKILTTHELLALFTSHNFENTIARDFKSFKAIKHLSNPVPVDRRIGESQQQFTLFMSDNVNQMYRFYCSVETFLEKTPRDFRRYG